jgi:hypothetical protein
MNFRDWVGVVATMTVLTGSVTAAGTWAADQRYVTQEGMNKYMLIRDIRDIERDIAKIKKKKNYGKAESWEIGVMIDLQVEVNNLKLRLRQ